jgi:hypothetical protein
MGRISMATRDELVGAPVTRYAASDRKERGRIEAMQRHGHLQLTTEVSATVYRR